VLRYHHLYGRKIVPVQCWLKLPIIGEANFLCQSAEIDSTVIEQALSAREYRNGRIAQSILEEMLDGTILINTSDSVIGQVNGLTVLQVGGSSFGQGQSRDKAA
jgi:predicted ATP-dependent protease